MANKKIKYLKIKNYLSSKPCRAVYVYHYVGIIVYIKSVTQ